MSACDAAKLTFRRKLRMKKAFMVILAAALILAFSASSMAKDNTISLTGAYSSTILGVEYERRIGDFGVGVETSMLMGRSMLVASMPFAIRLNALGRYYLNLSPQFKPYVNLGPGVLLLVPPAPEPMAMSTIAMFDMQFSAGLEYTPGSFRIAAEAGYEMMVYPSVAAGVGGTFFFKAAAGYRF